MNDHTLQISLGLGETYLALTPRWADLPLPWLIASLGALIAVPLALLLMLSRYELRLVPRRHALGLLLLRFVLLASLWFVIAFQPTVTTHHEEETPGRVRIAVDLSGSMDVRDPQRSPAEKLRLARTLRLQGNEVTDDELEEWARQHERNESTTWLKDDEASLSPEHRNEKRKARQTLHDRLLDETDRMTRRDVVRRLLGTDGLSLLKRLSDRHEVEIVGFHESAFPLTPAQLEEHLSAPSTASRATDIGQAFANASAKNALPLLGVVLLSDGQHNHGAPPAKIASQFGAEKSPVFAIGVGSRSPPSDWMVVELQAPGKVFKDVLIPVQVRCQATQLAAQELTVELSFAGKPTQEKRTIAHDGKDRVYALTFQVPAEQVGTHALKVEAKAKQAKEVTLANNERSKLVRVVEEKAKVLLIDEDARWEHQYLASALMRDPTMQVDRVLFSQPRLGLAKDEELEKRGHARATFPQRKDEQAEEPLHGYDAIVVGDVAPERLPPRDRARLERYVSEQGGTLIFVAGKRSLPLEYLKEPASETDPLMKMLPITEAYLMKPEAGFRMLPTPEGARTAFLNLEPDSPGKPWPELPQHYWGIAGTRKPGASVLLYGSEEKGAKPTEDKTPGLLVTQNYGFGRVVYLGIDSSWRWRYKVGDTYHHRFWNQLLRWAAADKLLPAGNRFVRFGTREPTYQPGQEIELQARFSESLPPMVEPAKARAKLLRRTDENREELIATIPLIPNATQRRLFSGKARDLSTGSYRIELDVPQYRDALKEPGESPKNDVAPRVDFVVEGKENAELLDLSTNWILLQKLADDCGGRLFASDQAERILETLSRRIERKLTHDERRPWQDAPYVWYLLGLCLGLLSIEWIWRKRLDLP
jgi:hypothetical protein